MPELTPDREVDPEFVDAGLTSAGAAPGAAPGVGVLF
jgi:hypothetical protein